MDGNRKSEWTRKGLSRAGFVGWHRFSELRSHFSSIDRAVGGVYVVYRETLRQPVWLDKSPGGTWHGDPTVPREELVANWVEGANVLNIGKAKHGQLRKRLAAYCSFGEGGKGRHYGGRLIWQLQDSADLLVAWRVISDLNVDPRQVEQSMINAFRVAYGNRPFANLTD